MTLSRYFSCQGYYPASFLSVSDSVIEAFYWINMYKLASATRPDRTVYDLMGPWYIEGAPSPVVGVCSARCG